MNDERLNVVPVTSSARKTPEVDSSAEQSTANGRGEIAELEQQHDEDQHDRQGQHEGQVAERALLFLVSCRRTPRGSPGGMFSPATAFCTSAMPAPRLTPSRRPVTVTIALQVLAADLGLSGQFRRQLASEPRVAVLPVALTSSVLRIASSEARVCPGKRTRMVIGAVVHNHRRGGRLALQDGAGVQFDFLRREPGARRSPRGPPGRSWPAR